MLQHLLTRNISQVYLILPLTALAMKGPENRVCRFLVGLLATLCCTLADCFVMQPAVTRPLAPPVSAMKEATFGMGCFWKPSEELLKVPGVVDTVVGYTGKKGTTTAPNYEMVCFSRDWVEGVRVQYDDDVLSYDELLDSFFEFQEPNVGGSRQYASFIFPHDGEQAEQAQGWLDANKNRVRNDGLPASFTEIEPLTDFWRAESYHQRYWEKQRPRFALFVALTAVSAGFLDEYTSAEYLSTVHTAGNVIVLAGLFYTLIERRIDTKTVQI